MLYLGIFDQKCINRLFFGKIIVIFCQDYTIVIFKISTLKFVYLQSSTKKQKCLNLGPKVPDLGIFELEFENNTVIFEIISLDFF